MRFYLENESPDLELLAGMFPETAEGVWFGRDEHGPYMADGRVRLDDRPEQRQAAAQQTLKRALGAAKLMDSTIRPVQLNGIQADDHGGRYVVAGVEGVARLTLRALAGQVVVDGVPIAEPPSPAPAMLHAADANPVVNELLELLGASALNWDDLYKAYEIVRQEAGGTDGLEKVGWASRRDQSAFRASANRPDISGRDARHARENSPERPKNVMSHAEGRDFVLHISRAWLQSIGIPT